MLSSLMGSMGAHFRSQDVPRTLQAKMGGSDSGNAHAGIDKTIKLGIWLTKLLSPFCQQLFQQSLHLSANEAISGDNDWQEMLTLLKAGLKILLPFLPLVGCLDFYWALAQ